MALAWVDQEDRTRLTLYVISGRQKSAIEIDGGTIRGVRASAPAGASKVDGAPAGFWRNEVRLLRGAGWGLAEPDEACEFGTVGE